MVRRPVSLKADNAVEHLCQHASGVIDTTSSAPADIPVGADKNGTVGLKAIGPLPCPLGIPKLSAASHHMRNRLWSRFRRELRHGVDPGGTLRSRQ
jgi:hypothetical protein